MVDYGLTLDYLLSQSVAWLSCPDQIGRSVTACDPKMQVSSGRGDRQTCSAVKLWLYKEYYCLCQVISDCSNDCLTQDLYTLSMISLFPTFASTIKVDDFTAQLFKIYKQVLKEGVTQVFC